MNDLQLLLLAREVLTDFSVSFLESGYETDIDSYSQAFLNYYSKVYSSRQFYLTVGKSNRVIVCRVEFPSVLFLDGVDCKSLFTNSVIFQIPCFKLDDMDYMRSTANTLKDITWGKL